MRFLVVHCHPCPDSFNAALFALAQRALQAAGHEVRALDLYASGFDPVLSRAERQTYDREPERNAAMLRDHVELLRWAEGLALVFPTWFYGPPALLKGWLERVWLPGVAFTLPRAKGERVTPLLQQVRCLVCVTTSGSPWWWLKLIRDPGRNLFVRGLRALFHPRCRTLWLQLHDMNNVSASDRAKFLARVEHRLRTVR